MSLHIYDMSTEKKTQTMEKKEREKKPRVKRKKKIGQSGHNYSYFVILLKQKRKNTTNPLIPDQQPFITVVQFISQYIRQFIF